jgi:antitoxin component HigA of HigAB toxin-antitoxin module
MMTTVSEHMKKHREESGVGRYKRKITDGQVLLMVEMKAAGISQHAIARAIGVTQGCVSNILHGKVKYAVHLVSAIRTTTSTPVAPAKVLSRPPVEGGA